MSTEIDSFIQEQKKKIARERGLEQNGYVNGGAQPQRKQWKRDASTILQEYASQYAPERGYLARGEDEKHKKAEPLISERPDTPDDGGTLLVGERMDDRKNRLAQERKKEYNDFINRNQVAPRRRPVTPQEVGLPLGTYEDRRKELNKQRKREYNDMLQHKNQPSPRREPPRTDSTQALNKVIGAYDRDRKRLDEDRRREYNEMLKEKNAKEHKENIPPGRTKPPTPEVGLIGKLGSYEERRKRLQDERKREYNEMIAGNNVRTKGVISPGAEEYASTIPGLKDDPSAQRSPPPRRRSPDRDRRSPPPRRRTPERDRRTPDYSPPPSRSRRHRDYDDRAGKSRRMEDEVEDEDDLYERFLRQRLRDPPRRGWATPTYEEILDKKRQEERAYRRGGYDEERQLGSDAYMRTSRSDGHLSRYVQDELKKFRQLDKEYEAKKVRFSNEARSRRVREDPDWLYTNGTRYNDLEMLDDLDPNVDSNRNDLDRVDRDLAYMRRDQPPPPRRRDEAPPRGGNFSGSLAVGRDVSASTDMRRKAAYRQELQRQMKQAQQNKKREKEENLKVNATGLKGIFQDDSKVQPSTTKPTIPEDSFRDLYQTPSDDAYNYYGKVNPLDPNAAPEGISLQDQLGPPRDNYRDRADKPQRISKVADPQTGEVLPFPADDDRSRSRADAKKTYQQELKRQMEEDRKKKEAMKREQEEYDRKLDEEIRNYNPYGKGGGGAPMRDVEGNVLADLRKMNIENTENLLSPGRKPPTQYSPSVNFQSPRKSPPPVGAASHRSGADDQSYARGGNGIFGEPMGDAQKKQRERYQDDLKAQIEEKKRQAEEEKRKLKEEEEKLLQKIEEENAKMQAEFEKEKAKERAKQEAAQRQREELRREQEEKKKEAERKRKEAEEERLNQLRKEEEERRRERERLRQEERDRSEFRSDSPHIPTLRSKAALTTVQEERRSDSPPVPALRSKTDQPPPVTGRNSPPVPAQRTQSRQSRAQSADVLNQLARLKQQLQSESKRVETDLRSEQKEPEVYDPRLYQRPDLDRHHHVDVFDVAANKQPVPMHRNPDDSTDPNSMNEFKKLKKGGTASRQQLHKLFPDTPTSGDALEAQQRALLQAQEDQLDRMKKGGHKSPYERQVPDMTPKGLGLLRDQTTASANLLDSDSAFIDIPENGYPEDFDDIPRRRNDSARSRRRNNRLETPTSYRAPSERSYDPRSNMGSTVSLDPDRIDRRNEERLRKLKSLTGDEQSLADPDDILDRFMSKQHHTRPPSGHTLQDDSWLRPGTYNR